MVLPCDSHVRPLLSRKSTISSVGHKLKAQLVLTDSSASKQSVLRSLYIGTAKRQNRLESLTFDLSLVNLTHSWVVLVNGLGGVDQQAVDSVEVLESVQREPELDPPDPRLVEVSVDQLHLSLIDRPEVGEHSCHGAE